MLSVGIGGTALQTNRIVTMVTGHGNIHAHEIGVTASLHIAHRTKAEMCRQLVLLATGGFAGMAADAIVGGKMKAMLLVAIAGVTHGGIGIDVQAGIRWDGTGGNQVDGVAIDIVLGRAGSALPRINWFIVSELVHSPIP